jgi:probable phosphoglycerate mutase
MRHADVSYFDAAGKPLRPDTVSINAAGRQQAEAAARELSSVPFDRVLTSDLPRCVETAQILVAGRGLSLQSLPELREIRPGRLADLPRDGVEQAFLGAFTTEIDRGTKFLGGEAFGSLLDRVQACWNGMLADRSWQNLLMVAHGGVNRAIVTHILKSGLDGFGAVEQDPCCLNIIDVFDDGRCLVRLLNHTPYAVVKSQLTLTTMETLYSEYRRVNR